MKRSALPLSTLASTALAACLIALAPVAQAQNSNITYTTVDNPSAVTTTELTCINDHNEFVGLYDDALGHMHSFAGKKGSTKYKNIDYPGSVQTYVTRINNWGEIVGTYFDQQGYQHGFIRIPALLPDWPATYVLFDVPGAGQNQQFDYELGTGLGTSAYGLNNRGEIVGQYADQNGVGRGYILSANGYASYTDPNASNVPGFLGGTGLADISDDGHIAGEYASANPFDPILVHGFLLSRDRETLVDPPASILTQVFGLNNSLEVCGFYYDAQDFGHGFIFSKGKYLIIDVPGAFYISTVGTINNSKEFVGEYVDIMGITHGYLATRR